MRQDISNSNQSNHQENLKKVIKNAYALVKIAANIGKDQNKLEDADFKKHYNNLSTALIRYNNGNKSVRCYAYYAGHRRSFPNNAFNTNVLAKVTANQDIFPANCNAANAPFNVRRGNNNLVNAAKVINEVPTGANLVKHEALNKALNDYVDAATAAVQAINEWQQQGTSNPMVNCNLADYYKNLY